MVRDRQEELQYFLLGSAQVFFPCWVFTKIALYWTEFLAYISILRKEDLK